jgi:hypothetical protein
MKFVPMYGLESLTEQQKQDYYNAACEFLGLPPEMGVLSYHWMDQHDGPKKLVLYAKKGATDIIRERLGISVIDLKKESGNGEVTWIAKGQNKEGRIEMSSGSKSTEGLKGRELESAVMWAQTKALRRMTLQFVGAGILDETEVEGSAPVATVTSQPVAQPVPQPTTKPNSQAGEVVPVAQAEAFKRRRHEPPTFDVPFKLSPAVSPTADIPQSQQSPTSKEFDVKEFDKNIREATQKGLDMAVKFVEEHAPIHAAGEAAFANLQRMYAERDQVNSAVPTQVDSVATTARIETIIKPIGKAMQAYKDQLYTYTNEILPKAGMVPDENGGIAMKLRAFGAKRYSVEELKYLSVAQWEDFFKYLDETVKSKGAAELVKIIDTAVANV